MILRMAARIATYLLYFLTVISAIGGYIPPSIWALPSVLTLAFPYLLIACAVVAVCWLLGKRLITAILGGVVVVLCWPIAPAACPLGFSSKAEKPDFTLMTYNVYQLQSADRHGEGATLSPTLSYIIGSAADIVCIQELSYLPNKNQRGLQSDSLKRMYPYIIPGKEFQGDYTPFMLLSRYPAKEVAIPETLWSDCSLYKIRLPRGLTLHILNVHLTSYQLSENQRRVVTNIKSITGARQSLGMEKGIYGKLAEAFLQRQHTTALIKQLTDSITGPLIICGDFNDVPGSYAYRTLRTDHMADAVAQTTFGPMVTYNAHAFWFHIDQILYREGPLKACSVEKGKLKSSDHYPLTATFSY